MLGKKFTLSTPLLFSIVVAASALFRITNLALIEFKADEAINLFLASRPLFGHSFPPGGTVSSVGILNPPLLNYLLLPFLMISLDPKVISFFIGLINSLAIGFFFLLLRRYYNLTLALVASLLFAFSPWAILFSRKIWTQNLILPFLIILLFSLHGIVAEKKMIYWIPYVVASLFILQLHQSALAFLFLLNLLLLIKRVKLNFTYILVGFILGVIPLVPYLVYLIKNFSSDPGALIVAKERFSPEYFPLIFFRPFQIMSQGNFHFVLGEDMLTFAQEFPLAYYLRRFFYLEYLLLPLGVLIFWKKFPDFRFLAYATIGLPFFYFLLHIEPFVHYFIIVSPLLFLFLATGLVHFLPSRHWLKITSFSVFLGLIIVSLVFNAAFFGLLNQQKTLKGDYGGVFVAKEQVIEERLQPYQDDEAYPEMVLASYLPKNLLYGNLPVPKMLYSPRETQDRLLALEERLKQVPEDARVQNQLLAFYTISPPTTAMIELLKTKSEEIPGYQPIYEEVQRLFLRSPQPDRDQPGGKQN